MLFSGLFFSLCPLINLCIVVEVSQFLVFVKVIFGFSNIYKCSSVSIDNSHSLSVSGVAISGYPSIIFMMSVLMFFFNKNIVYMLLVLAFNS